jgi:PIN domain nuclease of toxin-antitoxin system
VRLLLDTCSLIWLAGEPDKLSTGARAALDDDQNDILLSDVSVLEVCLKWQSGKLVLPNPPRMWIDQQVQTWEFEPLALERTHMFRSAELPAHHRDPFDRLLVSQAIEEGLTIVTPDAAVSRYPVATLW